MQNEKKADAREQRDFIEAQYTNHRVFELELNPIQGQFDTTHLQEIHFRIFQDLPGAGYHDVMPGEFRPPTPIGKDWVKNRILETVRGTFCVAYSRMDIKAKRQLDKTLKIANPTKLARLRPQDFIAAMAKLYTELDYLHPFLDGNSRTLRLFTRQVAYEAGYELDWDQFNLTPRSRDALRVARDKAVNFLAQPNIQSEDTKRNILFTLDSLHDNKDLHDLLKTSIRPLEIL